MPDEHLKSAILGELKKTGVYVGGDMFWPSSAIVDILNVVIK